MAELHETMYGKKLLEGDIPGIKKALERIALALELMVAESKGVVHNYDKEDGGFMISQHAYQGKVTRILNTISNSTAEDLADVITAIKNDEIT